MIQCLFSTGNSKLCVLNRGGIYLLLGINGLSQFLFSILILCCLVWSCVALRYVALFCVVLSFLGLTWFWLVAVLAIVLFFRVSPDPSPCCYAFLLFDAGILISLSGMMLKLHLNIKYMGAKRNTFIANTGILLRRRREGYQEWYVACSFLRRKLWFLVHIVRYFSLCR